MKKIGVIINPNAKKFRTSRTSIDNYLQYKSDNVIISTPQNIGDLQKTANLYKSMKPDYICIAGGDGTIHLVVSELINVFNPAPVPPVLILKEGTMDNIARTVKLKGRGPALLRRLLKAIQEGVAVQTESRYTIKIQDRYCFLFGTGIITNFLNKAYSGREKGFFRNIQVGLMTAGEALLNVKKGEIFNFTEQQIFIDAEMLSISHAYGILAGTVEHVGMGFSPLRNAVQSDGTFRIIVLAISPWKILRYINKLRTGRLIKSTDYINKYGKLLIVKQSENFEYTMDGDIYLAHKELEIKTGPVIELVKI